MEREGIAQSTFIAFRPLLPLRLFRSMFAKAFRLVVPRRRRINGKRPAACAPEFRVEVLALSSCSLQIKSNARRKSCRCSFEIRGFRRPGNEFRMPCEGPGFRLIQRPIWCGKFELHAHTSRRTVEIARAAGGVFPRSAGRPSPCKTHCSTAHISPDMTVIAELGDITRFANPRQLMAYRGLVPSEHSSGATRRQGSITKAGNGAARRMLIKAAWSYLFSPPHS